MSKFELITLPSAEQLADTAAGRWLDQVRAANHSRPFCVALSGGRIARLFFSAAAGRAKAERTPLDFVHFFWSDERCVPPSDPESNFAIARELLLGPLDVAARQIHRVRGEAAPERAAEEATAEICRIVPGGGSDEPALDLIFLGMGEDGHVASLFPGEPEAVMASKSVYRPVVAAKPPPHRITLGYPAIAAARHAWVLASGSGKENALRGSLAPSGRTPLARVLAMRSHTLIFTDITCP